MDLIINTAGTKIRRESGCFLIKNDSIKKIAAKKITQLLISSSVSISTDALSLAVDNNIEVLFLDKIGKPFARVWSPQIKRSAELRRKQLRLSESEIGSRLIIYWITKKISLQQKHLKNFVNNTSGRIKIHLEDAISSIEEIKQKINGLDSNQVVYQLRPSLQGYEGNVSKIYFNILNELLPMDYKFESRTKHPAKDKFNSMLNYGYGVLYGYVEKGCILAGLDPYIGIMHADQYNKPVLTYDIIEIFRIYIDQLVVEMCKKDIMKEAMFERMEDDSLYMKEEGKNIFLGQLNNKLQENKRYKGKQMKLKEIFSYECLQIAKYIMDDGINGYIGDL